MVDDAFTEHTGLLGATVVHPQLAHQAKPHESVAVPEVVSDVLRYQWWRASLVTPVRKGTNNDGDDKHKIMSQVFISD